MLLSLSVYEAIPLFLFFLFPPTIWIRYHSIRQGDKSYNYPFPISPLNPNLSCLSASMLNTIRQKSIEEASGTNLSFILLFLLELL